MLEALVSAHKIELIRIFLTKSRQDGDLQICYLNDKSQQCNTEYNPIDVYKYVHKLCVSFYYNNIAGRTSI